MWGSTVPEDKQVNQKMRELREQAQWERLARNGRPRRRWWLRKGSAN